jgi:hypothetical protein
VAVRLSCALALIAALTCAAPAAARDPGRWQLTGESAVPVAYWQGVTGDGAGTLFFDGVFQGLYRTSSGLVQTGADAAAIPADVMAREGYNHIGDISYDGAEGGRVLLPLECYVPGQPNGGNTCGTGAFGVADPATLGWRYYVKLDPAEIAKAMWVERSPDGQLLWTSSGPDLLAYASAGVVAANAAPAAAPIRAARRLAGATPPSGVTGATFVGRRLFLAGEEGGPRRVWSVDPTTGRRRLELEELLPQGESEGLHYARFLGGELHWLIAQVSASDSPSGATTSLLQHFTRLHGRPGLRVIARPAARARPSRAARPRGSAEAAGGRRSTAAATPRVRLAVTVTRHRRPVRGAVVRFAGFHARTDAEGRAVVAQRFALPGRFRVTATRRGLRGASRFVAVAGPPR